MALTTEQIDILVEFIGGRFAAGAGLTDIVHAVKAACPGFSVTGAMASVMAEEPYRDEKGFCLYLVDGSNHCWLVTDKPENATAIVIGQKDEDDI